MPSRARGRPAPRHEGSDPGEACVFCAIVRGESPGLVVLADDVSVAFLDHRPLFPGHTLLVPRAHCVTMADLPRDLLARLFENAALLTLAVQRAFGADGSFVGINNRVSQSVAHLHVHIVPRRFGDGLRGFFWPRQRYADTAAMREAQTALRQAVADVTGESSRPGSGIDSGSAGS
jgi:histidine triad (HIT) family protein